MAGLFRVVTWLAIIPSAARIMVGSATAVMFNWNTPPPTAFNVQTSDGPVSVMAASREHAINQARELKPGAKILAVHRVFAWGDW